MQDAQKVTIPTLFSGNAFVCIGLSLSLGYVFGALEAVQVLVLQILFRLNIPANMYQILGPILRLVNFEVYPTEFIYKLLFNFRATESFDEIF